MKPVSPASLRPLALLPLAALLLAVAGTAPATEPGRFERTYTPQGAAHLRLQNINGAIRITAWPKRTIWARANADPSVSIQDEAVGGDVTITVKRDIRLGRADFEVSVPADTSLSLKNFMGRIEVQGVRGHITVDSFDSDVHLAAVDSPALDVKVTSGDIFFDGQLQEGGTYSLQSVKGDIDVTLPAEAPFTLNARALHEKINLGDFLNSLAGSTRGPRGISGNHLRGGPTLTLTAYAGRILLHKR